MAALGMRSRNKFSRGVTLVEVLAGLAILVVVLGALFTVCGGLGIVKRSVTNKTHLERAVSEAKTFAKGLGYTLQGEPMCNTEEIDGRYPCTLTLASGRSESLLCAGDYWAVEHGCVISTPFVAGKARAGAVVTGQ